MLDWAQPQYLVFVVIAGLLVLLWQSPRSGTKDETFLFLKHIVRVWLAGADLRAELMYVVGRVESTRTALEPRNIET